MPDTHRTTIRVVLVDDHSLVTDAIAVVVNAQPGLQVVGTARDVADARTTVVREQPDVVLTDVVLPSGDGLALAGEIKHRFPGTRVLVLTGHDDDGAVGRAIREGCDGFLRKTSAIDELVEAIRLAHAGAPVFSTADLAEALRDRPAREIVRGLSSREREVLELMAIGTSTTAMADRLFISAHTVRSHVRHILEKLGAHSKLEAVSIARREGLLIVGR